jgi:hypothetical protein
MKVQVGNAVSDIGGLTGPSLTKLIEAGGDGGILRPFRYDGKSYVSLLNGKTNEDGTPQREVVACNEHELLRNTVATLPHEVWLDIDQTVERAAVSELRAVNDLKSAGLTRVIPNGFAVQALMSQKASRVGTAYVGMDPQAGFKKDRPVTDTVLLPLPCIWSGFGFGARELATSRRGGMPLDVTGAEDATRACALMAEKMLIGNSDYDQYKYIANAVIYGYTDHGSRITFTITAPTASGWDGETLVGELLGAKQELITAKKKGPYIIYLAPAWSQYLDNDYVSANAGTTATITTRERILKINGFSEIRELDELSGWEILIVQMETQTVQEVIGMDWTTVQWEEMGGQAYNWMVMGIYVPRIRADYDGNCGIAHGTTS